MIERRRLGEVSHVQVNGPDDRAGGLSHPRLASADGDEIVHVERDRRHRQLARFVTPRRTRTVGVHLDADAVGIAEVERLADEMIRHSGALADLGQMTQEAAEGRTIGQQNGEVIQTDAAAPLDRTRPAA
jgi:hypothetical protein